MAKSKKSAEPDWHRHFATSLFNEVWRLLDKSERTDAEDDRMVHAAHASRFHWGEVGTPTNLAIGEWQISRVYATLRRAEPATFHAKRGLDLCLEHGLGDFVLAYAYESLARADAVAGRKRDLKRHLALAFEAGQEIRESDDRKQFLADLETVTAGA